VLTVAPKNQGGGPVLRQSLASQASLHRKSHTELMNLSFTSGNNGNHGNNTSLDVFNPKNTVEEQLKTLIGGSMYGSGFSSSTRKLDKSVVSSPKSDCLMEAFDSDMSTMRRRRRSMGVDSLKKSANNDPSLINAMPTVPELAKDHQSAFERLGLSRSGSNTPGLSQTSSQSSKL
jgi:hypothetical protein